MSVVERLKDLGLSFPEPAPPPAAFAPFVVVGNLLFLSGHIAKKDGRQRTGRLGSPMTTGAQGAFAVTWRRSTGKAL
jgi:enamine deaminase RidA (YjgF/YER057c/UK114 family)